MYKFKINNEKGVSEISYIIIYDYTFTLLMTRPFI
jgi:hypothetical protein